MMSARCTEGCTNPYTGPDKCGPRTLFLYVVSPPQLVGARGSLRFALRPLALPPFPAIHSVPRGARTLSLSRKGKGSGPCTHVLRHVRCGVQAVPSTCSAIPSLHSTQGGVCSDVHGASSDASILFQPLLCDGFFFSRFRTSDKSLAGLNGSSIRGQCRYRPTCMRSKANDFSCAFRICLIPANTLWRSTVMQTVDTSRKSRFFGIEIFGRQLTFCRMQLHSSALAVCRLLRWPTKNGFSTNDWGNFATCKILMSSCN